MSARPMKNAACPMSFVTSSTTAPAKARTHGDQAAGGHAVLLELQVGERRRDDQLEAARAEEALGDAGHPVGEHQRASAGLSARASRSRR